MGAGVGAGAGVVGVAGAGATDGVVAGAGVDGGGSIGAGAVAADGGVSAGAVAAGADGGVWAGAVTGVDSAAGVVDGAVVVGVDSSGAVAAGGVVESGVVAAGGVVDGRVAAGTPVLPAGWLSTADHAVVACGCVGAVALAKRARLTSRAIAAAVTVRAFGEVAAFTVGAPGTLPPPRYGRGSRAAPSTRVSKCRCGPVQLPVQPT